jgi:3',5'-cyclic-AMP phosphodiesterase
MPLRVDVADLPMIRITSVEKEPIHGIAYQFPETGGRIATGRLEILRAWGTGIPVALQALIVMSDLQGREHWLADSVKECRLLGEIAAEELSLLCEIGDLPPSDSIGVVLAGDLFVVPDLDKRGGKGDVRRIWQLLAEKFRWVAGIAGNHDRFGSEGTDDEPSFSEPNIHYVDGDTVEVDGLRLGGVAGVIGNPSKPFRRDETRFLAVLKTVTAQMPDLLTLHEGPCGITPDRPGNAAIRSLLEGAPQTLVVCGHNHWQEHEIEQLANGTQVLNADAKVYVIMRS